MIKMNITLGLWRLWVLLTVCWAISIGIIKYDANRATVEIWFWSWAKEYAAWIFIPPLGLLLLGLGIGWVVNGFRRPA